MKALQCHYHYTIKPALNETEGEKEVARDLGVGSRSTSKPQSGTARLPIRRYRPRAERGARKNSAAAQPGASIEFNYRKTIWTGSLSGRGIWYNYWLRGMELTGEIICMHITEGITS
ncbi:hypothetical protein RUND412_010077, partial [Rhizina undulata]